MNEECPICYEVITIKDAEESLICFTCNYIYCKNCCNTEYIVVGNKCAICNQTLKLEEDDELFHLINISLVKKPEEYLHLGIVFAKIADRYFNYNFKYAVELYKQAHKLGLEVPYIKIADQYFNIKDYQSAILWYQVTPNDSEACYKLGTIYSILESKDLSIKWLKQAAYLGDNRSLGFLGHSYQQADNFKQARYWYELGSEFNDITSINNLGVLYNLGYGVKKDKNKALKLFKKASDIGSRESTYNLAMAYRKKGLLRKARNLLSKIKN